MFEFEERRQGKERKRNRQDILLYHVVSSSQFLLSLVLLDQPSQLFEFLKLSSAPLESLAIDHQVTEKTPQAWVFLNRVHILKRLRCSLAFFCFHQSPWALMQSIPFLELNKSIIPQIKKQQQRLATISQYLHRTWYTRRLKLINIQPKNNPTPFLSTKIHKIKAKLAHEPSAILENSQFYVTRTLQKI